MLRFLGAPGDVEIHIDSALKSSAFRNVDPRRCHIADHLRTARDLYGLSRGNVATDLAIDLNVLSLDLSRNHGAVRDGEIL